MVSAARGGELIAASAADARIHSRPGTIDKIGKLSGARNPARAALAPRRAPGNQDHQSSVRVHSPGLLRSDMYHVRSGVPEAVNRANTDDRDPISRRTPAYCRQYPRVNSRGSALPVPRPCRPRSNSRFGSRAGWPAGIDADRDEVFRLAGWHRQPGDFCRLEKVTAKPSGMAFGRLPEIGMATPQRGAW